MGFFLPILSILFLCISSTCMNIIWGWFHWKYLLCFGKVATSSSSSLCFAHCLMTWSFHGVPYLSHFQFTFKLLFTFTEWSSSSTLSSSLDNVSYMPYVITENFHWSFYWLVDVFISSIILVFPSFKTFFICSLFHFLKIQVTILLSAETLAMVRRRTMSLWGYGFLYLGVQKFYLHCPLIFHYCLQKQSLSKNQHTAFIALTSLVWFFKPKCCNLGKLRLHFFFSLSYLLWVQHT